MRKLLTARDENIQNNTLPGKENLKKDNIVNRKKKGLNDCINIQESVGKRKLVSPLKENKTIQNKQQKNYEIEESETFDYKNFMPPIFGHKVFDIDREEVDEVPHCTEYVNDIYRYLFTLEKHFLIDFNFLEIQDEITENMRSITVDWLVQIHNRFRMMPETLQLTVKILDLYLSKNKIKSNELQLVAVTSMMLAAKYEEIMYPEISDFAYITQDTYTTQQILEMELKIVVSLDFNFCFPLPIVFLRRFSKAIQATTRTHKMAKYFLESLLIDSKLASLPPSLLAASSLYLASYLLQECYWNDCVVHYSTYTEKSLLKYVIQIAYHIYHNQFSTLRSVFRKYSDKQYDAISTHKSFRSVIFKKLALSTTL